MIIELGFTIPDTGLALEVLREAGLAVESVSTASVIADDGTDETAVRLAAWMWSADMMAWRAQRAVELTRVDAIMRRDESQKRLGSPGLSDEQAMAWEKYAQALRDGPETVTEVGRLPEWPEAPCPKGHPLIRYSPDTPLRPDGRVPPNAAHSRGRKEKI
jgi:hypothetical protein